MPIRISKSLAPNDQTVGAQQIPVPPEGATHRQLLDWAAVMSLKQGNFVQHSLSDRVAEAYLAQYHSGTASDD